METPREYYYTYYSYEEWGRGYIGSRGCKCPPEEDVKYFGSYSNKTFNPTQKIILGIYETREEAYNAEIILHNFYDVANNPHFTNKSNLATNKFFISKELATENGKKNGQKAYQLGLGIHGRTKEEMIGHGEKLFTLGIGIHSISKEERIENSRVGGQKAHQLGVGIHGQTKEKMCENSKKAYAVGLGVLSQEEIIVNAKKGGKITSVQKWKCTVTGYVSNPGALSRYQKKRNIDTSNRIRI